VANISVSSKLKLPCGVTVKNRFCKAAMTEGLAGPDNSATAQHATLYEKWAEGGSGILLTGNVQVDHRYLERPGNVVIEGRQSKEQKDALRAWAKAGTRNNTHLWMQISHAGRQTPAAVNPNPVGPSDIGLKMPGAQFGKPRALTEKEIKDVIKRFAHTAKIARETGFTGVQIHAAHGYLISEFLSPDVNTRNDDWGGSLENRARLLLEVVRAVRQAVGTDFPVSVKLNSADFQRGGFSHEDAVEVARWLNKEKIDLLEVSGGTYEQPKLVGLDNMTVNPDRAEQRRESTIAREAYFLDYARDIRAVMKKPLMVTGGFRTVAGMSAALDAKACDVIGVGRPLCADPDIINKLLVGTLAEAPSWEKNLRIGPGWLGPNSPIRMITAFNGWGQQGWFCMNILKLGRDGAPDPSMSVLKALRLYLKNEDAAAAAYNAYRSAQ
jgi:2,4-dienoyl-CoA reductase-like NADH-dependent reductase (Old Yellow Enzyme family)